MADTGLRRAHVYGKSAWVNLQSLTRNTTTKTSEINPTATTIPTAVAVARD
jgi:hypothetical protein